MLNSLAHYVQLNEPTVGQPQQLVEREPQAAAYKEKRQPEERTLRGRVPEEEFEEEGFQAFYHIPQEVRRLSQKFRR